MMNSKITESSIHPPGKRHERGWRAGRRSKVRSFQHLSICSSSNFLILGMTSRLFQKETLGSRLAETTLLKPSCTSVAVALPASSNREPFGLNTFFCWRFLVNSFQKFLNLWIGKSSQVRQEFRKALDVKITRIVKVRTSIDQKSYEVVQLLSSAE